MSPWNRNSHSSRPASWTHRPTAPSLPTLVDATTVTSACLRPRAGSPARQSADLGLWRVGDALTTLHYRVYRGDWRLAARARRYCREPERREPSRRASGLPRSRRVASKGGFFLCSTYAETLLVGLLGVPLPRQGPLFSSPHDSSQARRHHSSPLLARPRSSPRVWLGRGRRNSMTLG